MRRLSLNRSTNSYVINSEAQKKMYKSMAKHQSTEPRDIAREWHSDCALDLTAETQTVTD